MDFALAPEAVALLEAAGPVLDSEATADLVRAGWPGSGRPDEVRKVWAVLADLGVVGALVDEDAGGLGLTVSDVVPLLERVGFSALPAPVVETVMLAAPLLAAAGHPALADVLTGRSLVTVATTTPAGDVVVPHGQQADLVILPAALVMLGRAATPPGWRPGTGWISSAGRGTPSGEAGRTAAPTGLFLCPRAELDLEPVATVDGARAMARLATVPAADAGTPLTDGAAATEDAWWRGALGTSALLVGLAARMVAMTVAYVRTREQFGVPIGSFQAVKHALASAHLAVEFARPAVLAAGWHQTHSPAPAGAAGTVAAVGLPVDPVAAARDATSVAKVLAADAARVAARASVQCHGAIGYTTEYDLHLFAKRVWALVPAYGDPAWHRARLGTSLGLPVPAR